MNYIPWNSQPLAEWSSRYAPGRFIELAGRPTHYQELGQGDPVILIHGFNMDGWTWMKNIDDLAQNHKLYVLDLWGMGFSARDGFKPGYDLYCEQIRLFMDALNLESASLLGHSMGGGTAIHFSVNNPERVRKLVLVDSTGVPKPLPLRSKLFMLPMVGEFLLGINNDYFRRKNLADLWFYDRCTLSDDVFSTITQFQKIQGTSESLLSILRGKFFHTLFDEIQQLNQLNLQILIIWGRHDSSVQLNSGLKLHEILEGSRLEIFEEGAHMPNFDDPDRFNKLVAGFLRT